ncbi:MAG: putative spermidine/putrescine transport system permease protein [Alphaproteobacteria bacterium]|jgi:putative spermidine/putrescine transport system permease protein|nr:putative spermidine/putrescine transport system permease protein [Alphaproteobacteria bacterium]
MGRFATRIAWSRNIYLLGLLTPAVAAVMLILSIPVAWLVRISLFPQDQSYDLSGWSAVHYMKALTDDLYLESLARTTIYSLIVTLGTAILGFPLGYAAARGKMRRWKIFFIVLPLTLSLIVNIFGWIMILGQNGLLNSVLLSLHLLDHPKQFLFGVGTVLVVLGHTYLPFQILSVMSVVRQIDPMLEEASASLRGNRWVTFWRVIIPLSRPGIVAGCTIVFILTISAFIIPQLIGGASVQMYAVLVFQQMMTVLNWPFGSALSLILLVVALGFAALLRAAAGRSGGLRSVVAK